ncbi:MAG TPA: hypothetical protein VM282_05595 [Acidimicrobiales bacterium]|nr:hypothetical protein [Acidimicrobiales bacterium]
MIVRRASMGEPPPDPVADAAADAIVDILGGAEAELVYSPTGEAPSWTGGGPAQASATGAGPAGWDLTVVVTLGERIARLVGAEARTSLEDLLEELPPAALRASAQLRDHAASDKHMAVTPAVRRAVRDTVATEILSAYLRARVSTVRADLVGETIEYLIELSGTRVESHDLTHGVVVADVLQDSPRLEFAYPADIRAAKRAPLLFDGQQSLLIVDPSGRARRELQRHRFEHLVTTVAQTPATDLGESGSLVASATQLLGGLGFFLRADRSIWTFVDGRPLLVRRSEHWTAFPLELSAGIADMIGGGSVAALVTQAALMISARPRGAILAIVEDASDLDGVVSLKDRYDLRNDIDPLAMQFETRLHHLIDAEDLDEHTLVRLAMLDGATVLDTEGRLLAYGAIVSSADSEHEGARTAAAKTLSETAMVVLKVSVDGDITIFRAGEAVATLLGRPAVSRRARPFGAEGS